MKIVTAAQMAALELASQRRGVTTDTLMENAGLAVAETSRRLLGGIAGAGVVILVGPGNNGADGLVAARHLRRWGAKVAAYVVAGRPAVDPKMDLARAYDVEVISSGDDPGMDRLGQLMRSSRMIIDAVLGTGRARPLEGEVKEAMLRLRARRAERDRPKIIALDLPTGLNSDSGEVDSACPEVDVTVALGRPKAGLLAFPGAAWVGRLEVADIGLPSDLEEEEAIALEMLTPGWVGQRLPSRPLDSHKGSFGHALVVAGSRNYVGAAYLSSLAATRVGAGLVTLATPCSVYKIAAGKLTEVIHLPLPEDEEGRIHPDAAGLILNSLDRYNALLMGCGLGWSQGTVEFVERLLLKDGPRVPTVIDADGLNNLSRLPQWWRRLGGPAAVTPHPGEMATLAGISTSQVQKDRIETARRWAADWNVDVTLKGAHTVIAQPGGTVRVSHFANPGLASGGTGDVLSGIIVGLMAQGLSAGDASCCGVYLHGLAAENVRENIGESGTVASDLIGELPVVISQVRRQGGGIR
jgi:hydroxyethylthiazole kinase-like uncharacterized protein yjeF